MGLAPVLVTFLSAGTGSLIRVTEEGGEGTVLHSRERVRQEQLWLWQQEPEAAGHVTLGQEERRSTGILLVLLY